MRIFPWLSHSAQDIFENYKGCCCRQAHPLDSYIISPEAMTAFNMPRLPIQENDNDVWLKYTCKYNTSLANRHETLLELSLTCLEHL